MLEDDWQRDWREYLRKMAHDRDKRSIFDRLRALADKLNHLNAKEMARWDRIHPNPPEMNELERDIFFRYVDEILQDEKAKRGR